MSNWCALGWFDVRPTWCVVDQFLGEVYQAISDRARKLESTAVVLTVIHSLHAGVDSKFVYHIELFIDPLAMLYDLPYVIDELVS